jgi:Fe-S cluster assembly iron-binding protein IscA
MREARLVLTLTSSAADAVKTMANASPELPGDSGLRITVKSNGEDQVGLALAMVEHPSEGDQVIEESGARVFVDPEAAVHLDNRILDATVVGNNVQFSVSEEK